MKVVPRAFIRSNYKIGVSLSTLTLAKHDVIYLRKMD
jgi:hypothetical protein